MTFKEKEEADLVRWTKFADAAEEFVSRERSSLKAATRGSRNYIDTVECDDDDWCGRSWEELQSSFDKNHAMNPIS